jgi:hypothetical protein
MRKERSVFPIVKHIDTVAGEFPAHNNYLYVTYNGSQSDVQIDEKAYIVLGSGAYRIGSSVEFDWCAVNCIRNMRSLGHKVCFTAIFSTSPLHTLPPVLTSPISSPSE